MVDRRQAAFNRIVWHLRMQSVLLLVGAVGGVALGQYGYVVLVPLFALVRLAARSLYGGDERGLGAALAAESAMVLGGLTEAAVTWDIGVVPSLLWPSFVLAVIVSTFRTTRVTSEART
jgi:hypothetical protein